ncbi:helix-turn-helix domain-containing protein [Bradyrhizobium sp. Pa8]|uniref:helix-turn-helix domain-containing protein n=1 Tax=Bradyrhizobium sp. Pa8 TaxID=3386552 RepID=UPI00403F3CB9
MDSEIGRRIRLIRVQRNLSQEELGAVLGVSFQQVQKYEKGVNRVAASRLADVASRLSTSPHHLMGWQDKQNVEGIDFDTYKLAREFQQLSAAQTRAVRHLIAGLIAAED